MHVIGILTAFSSLVIVQSQLPSWTGPFLDPLLPYGGVSLAANVTLFNLYRATPSIGTYNMAPMLDFHDEQFLATWKNSPVNEDEPGQRILYSQSLNGYNWTGTDGTNILFPNVSTNAYQVALFAEPTLHIHGRFYAAASATQFCLYPDQYQSVLLLRRVFTPGIGKFGPIFWANASVPAGLMNASRALGILTINETDATTKADIATLSDWRQLPCGPESSGSLKCEACLNGCQAWDNQPNISNERTHFEVPGRDSTVLLYRSTVGTLNLHASVRSHPDAAWVGPLLTNIPDDNANLNAGPLPDGRVYLLSNAMPNLVRDPLYLSTSKSGWSFNATTALVSCNLPIFSSSEQPYGCLYRYQGGAKQGGCQYPQGMSVVKPESVQGFWAIFSLNKEDIWVLRSPFSSLA
jgi:hypothetical protein